MFPVTPEMSTMIESYRELRDVFVLQHYANLHSILVVPLW